MVVCRNDVIVWLLVGIISLKGIYFASHTPLLVLQSPLPKSKERREKGVGITLVVFTLNHCKVENIICELTVIRSSSICSHHWKLLAICRQSRVKHVTISILPVPEMPPEPLKTTTSLKKVKKVWNLVFGQMKGKFFWKKKLLLAFEDKDAMKFSVGF